jgi:hypothetical protein
MLVQKGANSIYPSHMKKTFSVLIFIDVAYKAYDTFHCGNTDLIDNGPVNRNILEVAELSQH